MYNSKVQKNITLHVPCNSYNFKYKLARSRSLTQEQIPQEKIVMSTKNGKKSRNRSNRHEEPSPTTFKQPPPTIPSLDEIPLPAKSLKKNIIPDQSADMNVCVQQDNNSVSPIGNENKLRDTSSSNRNRSRSNTPQGGKKMVLNNDSVNDKVTPQEEDVFIANGNGDGKQVSDSTAQMLSATEVYMEPLILDSNETEPELLILCDGTESDSPDVQQMDEQSSANKNSPRCATRRSHTRYVPTPETPHSFMEGTLTITNEEIGQVDENVVPVESVDDIPLKNNADSESPQTPTPIIHIASSILLNLPPNLLPCQQLQFETSSTNSNMSDSATDNCSTYAVVGSDITRMNIDDQQLTLPNDGDSIQLDLELEENLYAEIAEDDDDDNVAQRNREIGIEREPCELQREKVDSGGRYRGFDLGVGEKPRSREGSIARTLTGRKSIRPGTDYRKYMLERGMGGVEGKYTSTLGLPLSSSGIKRKTTPSDFLTSTPNTALKRRKLDTIPYTFNWFSYISQPLNNLKNRFTRSVYIATNTELPQMNPSPTLTGYKVKKSNFGEDTVDTAQVADTEQEEDEEEKVEIERTAMKEMEDVSLGIEAMSEEQLSMSLEYGKPIGKKVPIRVEVEERATGSNRKSCAIM